MKRSMFLFVLLACVFAGAQSVKSQTVVRPTQEQSLQELVAEVRQLRATLQRMNAAVYKGQVMLERLRLQQDQVVRLSRELSEVRESVYDVKGQQGRMREHVKQMEESVEAGILHPNQLAAMKAEMDQITQREQRLTQREAQLMSELEAERAKLNELNDRLNALVEIEMAPK